MLTLATLCNKGSNFEFKTDFASIMTENEIWNFENLNCVVFQILKHFIENI